MTNAREKSNDNSSRSTTKLPIRKPVSLATKMINSTGNVRPVVFKLEIKYHYRNEDRKPIVDDMLFADIEDAKGQLSINDWIKPEDLRQLSEYHFTAICFPGRDSKYTMITARIYSKILF